MAEQMDNLFDILTAAAPLQVALPVHEGVLKVAKALWQTPSSIPPTSKRAEKKYFVPAKGFECLYTHPVSVTNERDRQGQVSSTPKNKDGKWPDLFRRKVYSMARLQFSLTCGTPSKSVNTLCPRTWARSLQTS